MVQSFLSNTAIPKNPKPIQSCKMCAGTKLQGNNQGFMQVQKHKHRKSIEESGPRPFKQAEGICHNTPDHLFM